MSIIFVHSSLSVGGAEVLRKTIAIELLNRNIEFRICLLSSENVIGKNLREAGADIDVLGVCNSIYNPTTTWALRHYLKQQNPDIVQSSQFNSNFHTRIAARMAGIPVVICEEHGLYYWKHWWHKLADRLLVRWCDKIIAVSEAVKRFNVEHIGISEEKIQVLPNCIDIDQFSGEQKKKREQIRREFGIDPADFVFGHVGTLRLEKGHDLLLRAFAEFRKRHPAKLILVGDGPLHSALRFMTESFKLSEDVIFCGAREDVPALLTAMDCFVFPSRNEALGIALLEAMYVRLPIIGTKVGGIPEIIRHKETGLLVSVEDSSALCMAMLELYENNTLRRQLGAAAQQYVSRNHDPVKYVGRLLALHDELFQKKGMH